MGLNMMQMLRRFAKKCIDEMESMELCVACGRPPDRDKEPCLLDGKPRAHTYIYAPFSEHLRLRAINDPHRMGLPY